MNVDVNFTLNIDPAEWACTSASTIRPDAPDAMDRIAAEVRAHAENVVRDLFADMGWTVEGTECTRCGLAVTGPDSFGDYTDTEGQVRCTRIDGQPHRVNA